MKLYDKEEINIDTGKDIRERILETAEYLFSEKGFSGTKVREITNLAECNLAAINYHFGSKENLYKQVFYRHLNTMRNVRIAAINKVMKENNENITIEKLLREFAHSFIEPLVDKQKSQRFMKLMIYEMLEPTLQKSAFAEEVIIPTLTEFGKAVEKIYPEIDKKKMMMSMLSVVGQLLHIIHLNEFFSGNNIKESPMPNTNEMIDHIITFSAAGFRNYVKG